MAHLNKGSNYVYEGKNTDTLNKKRTSTRRRLNCAYFDCYIRVSKRVSLQGEFISYSLDWIDFVLTGRRKDATAGDEDFQALIRFT